MGGNYSRSFEYYKGLDKGTTERKLKIERTEGIKGITDFYETEFQEIVNRCKDSFSEEKKRMFPNVEPRIFAGVIDWIKEYRCGFSLGNIDLSLDDIAYFCKGLKNYEKMPFFKDTAGVYISVLITCVGKEGDKIELDLSNLKKKLDWFGMVLSKNINIRVKGDIGNCLGYLMGNGSITVEGSAGDFVGMSMRNGKITISKDAGTHLGFFMRKGEISIYGKTGNEIGYEMDGGKLFLSDNCGRISEHTGYGSYSHVVIYKGSKKVWPE